MPSSTHRSRLSPLNIEDTLMRAKLYHEIRAAQEEPYPAGWRRIEIQPADALMPELLAWRAYRLDTLKWVVMIAACLDDPRERLEVGKTITLPPVAWLRERIMHYHTLEGMGQ